MDFLTNLVEVVNNYLWNYVLLFLLVGTGVYFSVRRCHLLDVGERVLWHGHQLHRGGSGPEVPQHG